MFSNFWIFVFYRELKKLTIGYGSNELDKQKVGQVSKVVEDLFNATTRLNDIALVKLAKDVELDFKIEIDKLNPAGAKIAGWGNVKHKDERTPNHLKWIMLTHVKLSECKAKLLPEYTKGKISPKSNFCLSNKSSSACYVSEFSKKRNFYNFSTFFFCREILEVQLFNSKRITWNYMGWSLGAINLAQREVRLSLLICTIIVN